MPSSTTIRAIASMLKVLSAWFLEKVEMKKLKKITRKQANHATFAENQIRTDIADILLANG